MAAQYLSATGTRLCQTFQELAKQTWNDLRDSQKIGILRGEETITDDLLLALGRRHPSEVTIIQYNKSKEGKSGADWEWWLGNNQQWFKMRIQAKRLDVPNLWYKGINRKRGGQFQADRLISSAQQHDCYPAYVFYNYWDQGQFSTTWKCGSFAPQVELLGCTFADAASVRSVMKSRTTLKAIDSFAWPWMCVVCCQGYSQQGASLPMRARDFCGQLAGDRELIPKVVDDVPPYMNSGAGTKFTEMDDWFESRDIQGIVVINEPSNHYE